MGGDGSVHERKAGDVVAGLFTKYCAHNSVENLSSFNSAAMNIWVADKQEHSLFLSQIEPCVDCVILSTGMSLLIFLWCSFVQLMGAFS